MLFFTLYGGTAMMALLLSLYLLLSKVNVIAPGITPPVQLRRWAGAFFGMVAAGHAYWLLAYVNDLKEYSWLHALLATLDGLGLLIILFGTMISMLQDRRRPLIPFIAATMPIAVLGALEMVWPDIDFVTPIIVYALSLYTVFTIYMTNAVRQYQLWLRDNYADLEHKEVWASHTLLLVVLLLMINYGFADDTPSFLIVRLTDFILFALLLWRVETLQQLGPTATDEEDTQHTTVAKAQSASPTPLNESATADNLSYIEQLLTEKCEESGLYLTNGLTLVQLSAVVGVNRSYLSLYFSRQGINYNTYINRLRIDHFTHLYKESLANQQNFTAQQLAQQCGYRSYSTFSLAFKQLMGQSVSTWMQDTAHMEQNA